MLRLRWTLLITTVSAAILITSLPRSACATRLIALGEAVSRALQIAPAVDSAVAQTDLSGGRVEEARAPLFPWISANGEYNQAPGYDTTISNGGLTLAQLALTYTAFDGGRRTAQLRSARYAAQAAALGIKAAQAEIVFDVTVAYFDLLRQGETEAELNASVIRLSKYVNIVQALLRSGRAIPNDVLTLRVALDSTELSRAAAHQAAAQASIALGSMMGDFDDSTLKAAEVSGLGAPPGGDFSTNPAFQAAMRQVQAAELGLSAARAESAPTINLTLTSGWEGVYPQKTFGHHLGASYDGAVSVPLFQGGLIKSHIDQALASEHAALAQQRQIELQVRRDLADANERYRSALGQLAILRNSEQNANDAFGLNWTRFLGGGNVTLLEVTSAYQQAETLRTARFDQEFNARQATAQARMILGLQQ